MVEQPEPLDGGPTPLSGLEDLYRREYASMVRLAHLITGSNEVAEDVVQDSFVRLHRNWQRADQPGAYLRTVVVNRCRSWQRRSIMERRQESKPAGARPMTEASSPETCEILDALAGLSARQRAALVLRYYADLSEADIARALECRPGTVKSLLHRGLRQLEGMIGR